MSIHIHTTTFKAIEANHKHLGKLGLEIAIDIDDSHRQWMSDGRNRYELNFCDNEEKEEAVLQCRA